MKSV
ncbi:CLUMA_CG020083, isoform A [Clunio marinus]|jgi:translation initiation factor 2B subunit (eIF-2B alpha/beta/delta family)